MMSRGSKDNVYALLRKRITLGEYFPGERLKENILAEEFGISRTPIRAAFQRLIQDGLLQTEHNRGAIVAPWTDRDNDEVFALRALLESHAAALAAERRQEEHLQRLTQLNERMVYLVNHRPGDFLSEIETINRNFHQIIVQAAASPRLSQFIDSLIEIRRVIGAFFYYTSEELEGSVQDHIAITRAISQRKSGLSRTLMEDHIRTTSERLEHQRKQLPDNSK
ncbi:GntR family transcriptional regulator [Escherichia coli]|uniref:GntR family transcriptional regulator n=1 Tax=Enterobacteriaceae TaxID=543 RepID=UPI000774FA22|nr:MULTISPECIES: GntR family transcriptional regulator [Enterobacteriaceae]ELT9736118.1 GntR family transcriptional regulator [Klebsiella michiganensis]QMN62565.1 GntR family transcriptional regulator [Citrobacter freundii]HCI7055277.1 GntR family transcriptional regulator [Klebsiella quasipneumoniae subsp. quasipneumoniae]HDU5410326.1 GntR family transcriptional regulator [Klebsiella pneumoniae subsp. pneumoniae]EEW1620302.1 GntR family transcriptional regulator [Escherichia coli]